jgi:O-antigen/teichoic acid export membrane protein
MRVSLRFDRKPSSRTQVRWNSAWNVFGQGFPLLLAVFFIPGLISGVGTDKFGALTIIWSFLTYFSVFDLGIGRSLTQLLAGAGERSKKDEASLIAMSTVLLGALGAVATVTLFWSAPFLTRRLLKLEEPLAGEMILSLKWLGLVMPLLLHSLALKGILEAKRRFDLANLVRIPLGIFTYGAPLLVLPFSRSLSTIVAVLLLGRVLAWVWNLWMVLRIMPHLKSVPAWNLQRLRQILRFGGWVTVSSVVVPVMGSMDRIFITSILSISAVAFYATPFELVSKLWIIAGAIGGTIFPEFAARFHRSPADARVLYMRGVKYLLGLLFPIILVITAYAREGLSLWLNPDFAATTAPVLQWLALSTLIGGVAQVPYFFLLGVGRPEIPALVHVVQLVLYTGLLYLMLKVDGVRGAAIAFTLRVLFDFLLQFFFSGRMLRLWPQGYRKILLPLLIASALLLGFQADIPEGPKAFLVVGLLLLHGYLLWTRVLEGHDKATIRRLAGRPA